MAGTHVVDKSYAELNDAVTEINTKIFDKKPIDLIIRNITKDAFKLSSPSKLTRLKFNKQGVLINGKEETKSAVQVSEICKKLHGIQRDNPINITAILDNAVTDISGFLGLPTSELKNEDDRLFDYEVTEDSQEAKRIQYSLNLKLGNVIVKNTKQVTNISNAFSGIVARQASLEDPISVDTVDNVYRKTSINVVDLKRFSNVKSTSMMFNKAILSELDLTSLFESSQISSFEDFGKLFIDKTVIKMLPSPLVCSNVNNPGLCSKIGSLISSLIKSSTNSLYTSREIYKKVFNEASTKPTLVPVKAAYQYSYVNANAEKFGSDDKGDREVFYKKDYEKYLDGLARAAIYLKDESTGGLINTEELVNLINDADKVDRSGDIMRGTLKMSKSLIETASTNNNIAFSIIPEASGGDGTDEIYKVDTSGTIFTKGIIRAYHYAKSHSEPVIVFDKPSSYCAAIGPNGSNNTIQFGKVENIYSSSWISDSNMIWLFKGDVKANRVFNAVWNDLVDLIVVPDDTILEFGRCYVTDGKTYKFSEKYCQQGIIGIHSDTAGFGMGTVQGATQIHSAVAGYVLAFVDKTYPSGTPLTCGKNGTLTKMKLKDRIIHPERLVATFWKNEPLKIWNKQIKVNGRKWVKII